MSRRSAHRIVSNVIGQPLVIRDVGPWDVFLTVAVVQDLVESGLLPVGRRLFYLDSEGEPGELLIHADRFSGFAPVSEEELASQALHDRGSRTRSHGLAYQPLWRWLSVVLLGSIVLLLALR